MAADKVNKVSNECYILALSSTATQKPSFPSIKTIFPPVLWSCVQIISSVWPLQFKKGKLYLTQHLNVHVGPITKLCCQWFLICKKRVDAFKPCAIGHFLALFLHFSNSNECMYETYKIGGHIFPVASHQIIINDIFKQLPHIETILYWSSLKSSQLSALKIQRPSTFGFLRLGSLSHS